MKVCACCHFGCDGDGVTVHCNWDGQRHAKDGWCESGDDEVAGLFAANGRLTRERDEARGVAHRICRAYAAGCSVLASDVIRAEGWNKEASRG